MSLDAMKQALAAIEAMLNFINCRSLQTNPFDENVRAMYALRAAIEQAQEPVAWVYPEALEALKSGRPWTAYGSSGEGRIPLYLNDAVARKVEPRSGESGAGFESLPASSSTWWDDPVPQMRREWKGLTDDEREQFRQWVHPDIIEAIELKLQERNT